MKKQKSTFRLVLRFCYFSICLSLIVMGIFAKRGALDYLRMRQENREIGSKLAALESQKSDLEDQISRFENEKEEKEKVIRQVMGFVKPNETVIEFE